MKAIVVTLFLTTQAMAGIVCETQTPGSAIIVNLVKNPNSGPLAGTLRYLTSKSGVMNCQFNNGKLVQAGTRVGLHTSYSLEGKCSSSAGAIPFQFYVQNVSSPEHFGSSFAGALSIAGQYTQILCHVGNKNPL